MAWIEFVGHHHSHPAAVRECVCIPGNGEARDTALYNDISRVARRLVRAAGDCQEGRTDHFHVDPVVRCRARQIIKDGVERGLVVGEKTRKIDAHRAIAILESKPMLGRRPG